MTGGVTGGVTGSLNEEGRLASPLTIILIVLIGTISFCAFLVLLAYEPELRRGEKGGPDAYSRSAIGFAGLVEFLRAQDIATTISTDDAHGVEQGVLVLTPPPGVTLDKKANLRSDDGVTLVVLPKWETRRDPGHRGWVQRRGLIDPPTIASTLTSFSPDKLVKVAILRRAAEEPPVLSGGRTGLLQGATLHPGSIQSLQVIAAPDLQPVLTDAQGGIVLGRVRDDSSLYVLADPDLLNTHGLSDPATAATGLAILNALRDDDPITIDVTLSGERRARDLMRTAFEPPFLAATLCAAAAALLMGLHAARRFGPARGIARAFEPGKRTLAGNAASLIALARREYRMATPYAELTRSMTASTLNARSDAALDRIARTRRVEPPFAELRDEAETARNPGDLLRVARKLYAWRQDMLRAHR